MIFLASNPTVESDYIVHTQTSSLLLTRKRDDRTSLGIKVKASATKEGGAEKQKQEMNNQLDYVHWRQADKVEVNFRGTREIRIRWEK